MSQPHRLLIAGLMVAAAVVLALMPKQGIAGSAAEIDAGADQALADLYAQSSEAKALAAARHANKPIGEGIIGSPLEFEPLTKAIEKGFRAILLVGDEFLLADACQKVMGIVKKARE